MKNFLIGLVVGIVFSGLTLLIIGFAILKMASSFFFFMLSGAE